MSAIVKALEKQVGKIKKVRDPEAIKKVVKEWTRKAMLRP